VSEADLYAMLADAAVQSRDLNALQKYAALAEQGAAAQDHKLNLAIARRALGVLHTLSGEYAEAEGRLGQAMEIFAAYPAPWQVARTHYELGELCRARGQDAQAREHFSQALSGFEALRAAPYASRARLALESLPS
jgi:ATP/maltotriose-dependent transcriptional regulator MalT